MAAGSEPAPCPSVLSPLAHRGGEPRGQLGQTAEAANARRDQQCIGDGAGQHNRQHMRAPDALTQNEGVLRPDGEDQGEAQREAGDGSGHGGGVRGVWAWGL